MHSNHLGQKAGMLTIFAAVLLAAGCAPPPPASLSETDRAAINAATEAWRTAATNNDWAAVVANHYTDDAVVMPPNAPTVKGKAAIQKTFESFPPVTAMTLKTEEIGGSGDLAYSRGIYTLTMSAGDMEVQDRGKYMEVRRKQPDGKWLITADIWNSDMPLPESGTGM